MQSKSTRRARRLLPASGFVLPLILSFTVLSFALPIGTASAAWISLGGPEGARPEVRLLESTPDRIVLDYTLAGFYADPVTIDGQVYYRITLPHESNLLEAGLPELPHLCRSVIIPDRAGMQARVTSQEVRDFADMPVVPSKGDLLRTVDPATVPYQFDPAYGSGVFPEVTVRTGSPYILRDYRGMVVEALPFRMEGGTLHVAPHMRVELAVTGIDLENAIERSAPPERIVRDYREIYERHFLNFGSDRYTPVDEIGTMLVIVYDAFYDAMLPFVEWKNQEGLPTTMVDVSTIGNTAVNIKNYIQSQYAQGDLAFVLLVGDGAQIASPQAAGGSSDPSYSLLAGGDNYPELFVGRFSAETLAQVETQVTRSVNYEKTPMAGAAWYHQGTGIGSEFGTGDDGEYDWEHIDNIRTDLLGYGYTLVDQIYGAGATAAQVTAALNDGRSIVNYCGHGDVTLWGTTGFSNSNVNALTNDSMLPYIFSVACLNGDFEGNTCFAEAWLRATHNGNPTGAIAAYMSSILQDWDPPMCAQDEAVDLLVTDRMHLIGGLSYNGSCRMMDEYGGAGVNMFLTWHIFGDPSLMLRTKTPEPLTVQHDGVLVIGESTYAVTVPGPAGARCAIYGDGILYGAAYTNAAGQATITLDPVPDVPQTLGLTVTAYNADPYFGQVEVISPSGAYLVYQGYGVEDAAGGDGDGQCDAGETVEIPLTIRNVGQDMATGISGFLTTRDGFTTIQVEEQQFPDIPAGESATSFGTYQVSFHPSTPDNHNVEFSLEIDADQGMWTRSFSIPVGRPDLAYASHVVDDSGPGGNGTGWVGPGEAVNVLLTLGNGGHANACNVTATLLPDTNIVILYGTATCPDIPAGGEAELTPLSIRLEDGCPLPSILTLHADVAADYGYSGTVEIQFPVGGFPDDCEVNRGWTCGAPDDNATTGRWVLADPVGTTYNGYTVQPEDDHTPAPGVQCYVTGNGSPGGAAGEQDLDGGRTTLLSPVFDLHAVVGATVEYWVWYTNNRGNNPGQDYWTVQVTGDGVNWIDLEHTTDSTNDWVRRFFVLQDHLPLTDQVQLRFVADDSGANSLVEALIDDFVLTVEEPTVAVPVAAAPGAFSLRRIAPNPASTSPEIRFSVPSATSVRLQIYDVSGRLVRNLLDAAVPSGEGRILWDRRTASGHRAGAGMYYVRMEAPGFTRVRPVLLLE